MNIEDEFKRISLLRKTFISDIYLYKHIKTDVNVIVEQINHPDGPSLEISHDILTESGSRKVLSNLATLQRTFYILSRKDYTWFISEEVNGVSLDELIIDGPLQLQQAKHLTFLLLFTVDDLHRRGYSIRDWDPVNFHFLESMFKYVNYRGIVKNGTYTNYNTKLDWLGDPCWMAPEQLVEGEFDISIASVYCVGLYLYAFLTGEYFGFSNGDEVFMKSVNIPKLEKLKDMVDSKSYEFVSSILEVDPSKRPDIKQLLNHDFLKPHSSFPHIHPPIVFESGVKKWLEHLHIDPQKCLEQIKDLEVSEETLKYNLVMIAVSKEGNVILDKLEESLKTDDKHEETLPYIPDSLDIIDLYKPLNEPSHCSKTEKSRVDSRISFGVKGSPVAPRSPVAEVPSANSISYRPRSQSLKVHKLLDFCKKRMEERGINFDEFQFPRYL